MRRGRIQVVMTTCRRCGKQLATTNRAIYGADAAKAKYDRICSECVTKDEDWEIRNAQAQAILGREWE